MNKLYVVATPIGNIKDISERAVDVFKEADALITENQPTTKKLLNLLNIDFSKIRFFTYGDFNEQTAAEDAIDFILSHKNTVLVSEAGTPLISDPGYKIISKIRNENIEIEIFSIPGASAITTHLAISGLPTDNFFYIGFLPKKSGKKEKIIKSFADINKILKTTFVILESKYSLEKTLAKIHAIYPEATISIGNELTKKYEKVIYGKISDVIKKLKNTSAKGEYVIHLQV